MNQHAICRSSAGPLCCCAAALGAEGGLDQLFAAGTPASLTTGSSDLPWPLDRYSLLQ
jgi:hypothetical protein